MTQNEPDLPVWPGKGQSYSIAGIRDLLRDAFMSVELVRFCRDRPAFSPVVTQFSTKGSLEDIIDVLIDYCQMRVLLSELLSEVWRYNPRQYERHSAHLYVDEGVLPSVKPPDPVKLLKAMGQAFGSADFAILCFNLGVNPANLAGDVLSVKMLSLIQWHQQRDIYPKLVEQVFEERPNLRAQLGG